MPTVPNDVLRNVVFLQVITGPGRSPELQGTAFLISYPTEPWNPDADPPEEVHPLREDSDVTYLVTARHVIDSIERRSNDRKVHIRMNAKGGGFARPMSTEIGAWDRLPPKNGLVRDVAVAQIDIPEDADVWPFTITRAATPARRRVVTGEIDIGTDLFMPGLFVNRGGQGRNVPIVRLGAISAMADEAEPVQLEDGPAFAHLAEVRSIGGLSGSPVYANLAGLGSPAPQGGQGAAPLDISIEYGAEAQVAVMGAPLRGPYDFYLLGLLSAAFPHVEDGESKAPEQEFLNTGISAVIPVETILEVLNMDKNKKQREAERETRRKKGSARYTSAPGEPFTRSRFVDDLKKATRPYPPESEQSGREG